MCDRCFHQIYLSKTFEGQKAKTVLYGFIKIANESKRQLNKFWVDQGR